MNWLTLTAIAAAVLLLLQQSMQADNPGTALADTLSEPSAPAFTWEPEPLPQIYPVDTVPDQLPDTFETFMAEAAMKAQSVSVALNITPPPNPDNTASNRRAFLDMIAFAEGTSGPNGYRTLFGGHLFDSFADHPRQRFAFTNKLGEQLYTTAAGRYQFLSRTWDDCAKRLSLPDFSQASQDLAALELIRQRGAMADVDSGRISKAVSRCAPIWASLPGAGYAQPEKKLNTLLAQYSANGGNLEA